MDALNYQSIMCLKTTTTSGQRNVQNVPVFLSQDDSLLLTVSGGRIDLFVGMDE